MGQLVGFAARRDPRIAEALAKRLPNQPVLVEYIDFALRANRGTLAIAETLAEQLAPDVVLARTVSVFDAVRLAVHTSEAAMERLTPHLLALRPDALERATLLHMGFTVQLPPNFPVLPGSQAETDLMTCQRIFYCALAMLVGVKADPRSATAA